jgi:hypothetical protein
VELGGNAEPPKSAGAREAGKTATNEDPHEQPIAPNRAPSLLRKPLCVVAFEADRDLLFLSDLPCSVFSCIKSIGGVSRGKLPSAINPDWIMTY